VVQTRVLFARRHSRGLSVLEFEHGKIDIAIREVETRRAGTIDPGDFS
jgi:hypothetical protein